jgi:hypothetical protein
MNFRTVVPIEEPTPARGLVVRGGSFKIRKEAEKMIKVKTNHSDEVLTKLPQLLPISSMIGNYAKFE